MDEVRPPMVGSRSRILTFTPAAASSIAEARPPGPAPMMITSFFISLGGIEKKGGLEFGFHSAGAKRAPAASCFEGEERGGQRHANGGCRESPRQREGRDAEHAGSGSAQESS